MEIYPQYYQTRAFHSLPKRSLEQQSKERGSEVKMAKVPDLFEDLKHCYSENEDYSSEIDHLSLNQKSFYDANYDPLHEDCRDKFKSLSTSETSASSEITFSESMVVVTASGKVLKKRRLSLNQFITNDDLEAIASDTEEEIIKPRSAPYTFQNNHCSSHMGSIPLSDCITKYGKCRRCLRHPKPSKRRATSSSSGRGSLFSLHRVARFYFL
ncbi:Interleukin-1 alpha [Manis javanica]|nr:Interleukin-1 alpha [Manis javanica]